MPPLAATLPQPNSPAPWQGLGVPYPTRQLLAQQTPPSRPLTGPVRQQSSFQQVSGQASAWSQPPQSIPPQRSALETAALLNAALTAPPYAEERTLSTLQPRLNPLELPLTQPQLPNLPFPKELPSPNANPAETDKETASKRTPGTWLFDTMLYPVLTNFGVFAISVAATYMTNFGPEGNFLKKRGDWVMKFLTEGVDPPKQFTGLAKRLAKNGEGPLVRALSKPLKLPFPIPYPVAYYGKMLFFSFADGCIMAPVVKLFEDRRKPISQTFDKIIGTQPDDPSIYDQEPKQTWGSVLKGRLVASASIIPPFIMLTKKYGSDKTLNERIFGKPANEKIAPWVKKNIPKLAKWFPGEKLPGIIETCIFEAVFTSITTGALYLSSRFFADSQRPRETNPTTLASV